MARLNVYDFDGVLASPFEEALFNLNTTKRDADFVQVVSDGMNLDLSGESLQSARYICLQALMFHLGHEITPGPIRIEKGIPFHIVTARSDWYATARMRQFLHHYYIKPVKLIQMDHLNKALLLDSLATRHPDVDIRFWDDRRKHTDAAKKLGHSNLTIFRVDNQMEQFYKDAQSFYEDQILRVFLK